MTPGIEVTINHETWRTTGETRPDGDQVLLRVEAPTNNGGKRLQWISEDDYMYFLGV